MSHFDQLHLQWPFMGSRMLRDQLREQGLQVNRKRVRRLMRLMGMTAIYRRQNAARTARLSKGFRGIWDRLTGTYADLKRQNERDALLALRRDREEKDAPIFRHIEEREGLQQRIPVCRHGLVQPQGAGLAHQQHALGGLLRRGGAGGH